MNSKQRAELLSVLQQRFDANVRRHPGVEWAAVQYRLEADADKLSALQAMEASGGEPDIVAVDGASGAYVFFDCSAESPAGRRSLCYDEKALESRKENKPKHSAAGMASEMRVALMTEQQYRELQTVGAFDQKTSSWVLTPAGIRQLGGALFCDRRYGQVFTYHNGAESYYAARGFRCVLRV